MPNKARTSFNRLREAKSAIFLALALLADFRQQPLLMCLKIICLKHPATKRKPVCLPWGWPIFRQTGQVTCTTLAMVLING